MLIDTIIFVVALSPVAIGLIFCIIAWFNVPERTAEDVADYLVPVDLEKLELLLDPAVEYSYWLYLSRQEFRHTQLKRVHQFLELTRRMSRNATVLLDYANKESAQENHAVVEAAGILRERAVSLKLYSLATIFILYKWLLVRLYTPSRQNRHFNLPRLRAFHGVSVLDTYREVKGAAIALYSLRRPDTIEHVAQVL